MPSIEQQNCDIGRKPRILGPQAKIYLTRRDLENKITVETTEDKVTLVQTLVELGFQYSSMPKPADGL